MTTLSIDQLVQENEALRHRLEEAEAALRALRSGEVDAVVVEAEHEQVFTLETADTPYRLLVEQMPQAAATLTLEGSILYGNARFAELLRRPLAWLLGKSILDFSAPESRAPLESMLHDARTGSVRGKVTLVRADGRPVRIYLGVSGLEEGALGRCLMLTDLTRQKHYRKLKRAQKALRQSEAQLADDLDSARRLQEVSSRLIQKGDSAQLYEQILDAAVDIMHSDMASMQLVDEGRDALRLLAWRGFDPEFGRIFEFSRPDAGTVCSAARREGRRVVVPDIEACDFIVNSPELESFRRVGIRAAQSTPLIARSGRLLGMISTHWRTPMMPAERDLYLLDVLARLAADVIERSMSEEALREADRRKDEFLATLAHELRNPLAPLRNAVQILKAKCPPLPELEWARGVLSRQVHVMARLLEDLLDVSRIARGKLELRPETVELASVVEAAVETSRPVIDAAGHELTISLPPDPVYLRADPVRLAQVIANLLTNAAKYTEEGGRIELTAECRASQLVVSVKDNGIGILPEMLQRIFDIFAQASRALGRAQGGLGIGLSLVKGLVELQGGSIEAKSDGLGMGSQFIVRLPVIAGAPEPADSRPDEDVAAAGHPRPRVLVVDDNRDSADSLAMLLKILGHEVGTAYDGEQALEVATALQPDVILLDIGMPRLSGYEVCGRIRQQPWARGAVLIALTGWGQEEDRRRTEEAGFNHHMVKPVDTAELLKLLASLPAAARPALPSN